MSTPNSQPTSEPSTPASSSGSASAKKELFPQINAANAMGLAVNLFDKLRKQNSTTSSPIIPSLSALSSSSSASELAAAASSTTSGSPSSNNLFTNLALSFSKSRSSAPSSKDDGSKSKLPESLAIVDDDPVDDDDDRDLSHKSSTIDPIVTKPSKSPIPVSQSDISLSLSKSNFEFEPSSDNEPSISTSQSFVASKQSESANPSASSASSTTVALADAIRPINSSSSSSLLKFGSELANSALDEAETLRKRILTKKKSIELSFENMRNKVSHTTSSSTSPIAISPNSATNEPTTKRGVDPPSSTQDSYVSHTPLESILDSEPSSVGSNGGEYLQEDNDVETPLQEDTRPLIADQLGTNNSSEKMIDPPQAESIIVESTSVQESTPATATESTLYQQVLSLKVIVPVVAVLIALLMIAPSGLTLTVLTYLTGFLCGSLVTLLLFYLAIKLGLLKYVPVFNKLLDMIQDEASSSPRKENESITNLRNLLIQTALLKENKNFDGVYKGWMNELREHYDPENYFLNKTRSVFITLDGSMLRLQTTTSKVPKRAMWNEQIANCNFSELRIYDLSDCEVFILPKELVRKRYWSKKYPLCLKGVKLTNNSSKSSTTTPSGPGGLSSSPSSSQLSQRLAQSSTALPSSGSSQNLVAQPLDKNTVILFARTDREKEEWFKLFKKSAAKTLVDSAQHLKQQKAKMNAKISSSASSSAIAQQVKSLNEAAKSVDPANVTFSYSATSDKIIYKILDAQKPAASSQPDPTPSSTNGTSSATNGKEQSGTDKSQSAAGSSDSASLTSPTNTIETQTDNGLLYDKSLAFLNTFLIRTFADFFNEPKWINLIQTKIQKKLSTIKVPYFMEELRITGMDLGCVIPLIKQASEPWYDEKGLWVHLDIDYSGGLQMSLATKLNLMKLKSNASGTSSAAPSTSSSPHVAQTATFTFKNIDSGDEPILLSNLASSSAKRASATETSSVADSISGETAASLENSAGVKKRKPHSAITHSDEEDSPESSGDEYVHSGFNDDDNKLIETANASKKLLSLVNKIAASNYFQKATENKYIKMAMENVSNCQLLLTVEVRKISGTLALNIPPHPSDRLWYGFVSNPTMVLVATPQVGEKEVSYSAITDWIALKLKQEFQKILVFPNMDDLYIPLLNSEINNQNW